MNREETVAFLRNWADYIESVANFIDARIMCEISQEGPMVIGDYGIRITHEGELRFNAVIKVQTALPEIMQYDKKEDTQ